MAFEPAKDHIAHSLLARAHSPPIAETIHRERVKQRPLLLRPSSPDPTQNDRSRRQYERLQKQKAENKSRKSKPLSAKQKRALCIYEIPKSQQKYAIYEPLHRMWCGYMREILGLSDGRRQYIDAAGSGQMLASADYHGALVEVVRSRCISRVGLKGIVVKDTKFTFEIVVKSDTVKIVPKEGTVFKVELPWAEAEDAEMSRQTEEAKKPLVFEILGESFQNRAPDRANKRFKMHIPPDL